VSGKRKPSRRATVMNCCCAEAGVLGVDQGDCNQTERIFQIHESSQGSIGPAVTSDFDCFPRIFIPSGKHDAMCFLMILSMKLFSFLGSDQLLDI
jgi:hypothetical protein